MNKVAAESIFTAQQYYTKPQNFLLFFLYIFAFFLSFLSDWCEFCYHARSIWHHWISHIRAKNHISIKKIAFFRCSFFFIAPSPLRKFLHVFHNSYFFLYSSSVISGLLFNWLHHERTLLCVCVCIVLRRTHNRPKKADGPRYCILQTAATTKQPQPS